MSIELYRDHVTALQRVDLRFAWITYGYEATEYHEGFAFKNGPAMFGVSSEGYTAPAAMLADMDERDISARERIVNETPPGEAPSNRQVVEKAKEVAGRIPYIEGNPIEDLPGYQDLITSGALNGLDPDAVRSIPDLADALGKSLQLGSDLWAMHPLTYVDGLSALKGVRRRVADSLDDKLPTDRHERARRNADMAVALGDLAVDMLGVEKLGELVMLLGRRPRLAFTAGALHRRGVERIMDAHGIRYKSHVPKRTLSDKVFDASMLLTPPGLAGKRYIRRDAQQWFRNLRAHGYQPVNDNLGPMHLRDWQ